MNLSKIQINVPALLETVGGKYEAASKMSKNGIKTPDKTAEKWVERNSIPSDRLCQIFAISKDEGAPLNLYDFITDGPIQPAKAAKPEPKEKPKAATPKKSSSKPAKKKVAKKATKKSK